MENKSFEELFARYREISQELERNDIKLDDLVKLYEESNQIYKQLADYIKEAKVRINNIREQNV